MHPADIVATVHKRGSTLSAISLANGLSASAIGVALLMPSRRAEEALIRFLGLPPQAVFPDRYDLDGTRKPCRRRTPTEIANGVPLRPTENSYRGGTPHHHLTRGQ